MLQRIFKLQQNNTDVRAEVLAGVTTFMTLSYIIFVQPTVLAACGMNFAAVLAATCISSGRAREAHWIVYLFAVLFVIRYAFLR